MMQILSQVNINVICVILIILYMFYRHHKIVSRKLIFDRLPELLVLYDKAKEIAYYKVFRDDVLVHSASGFKINKDEIDSIQLLYIKLVFRISGPGVINDLKTIYGDVESICSALANEFVQRVEQDESVITDRIIEDGEENIEGE